MDTVFWLIDGVAVLTVIGFLFRHWHRERIRAERMRTVVGVLAVLIAEHGAGITDVLRRPDGYRWTINAWALALGIGCSDAELLAAKQDAPVVAQDFFRYLHSANPHRDYRERRDGYRWRRPLHRERVTGEEDDGASVEEPR